MAQGVQYSACQMTVSVRLGDRKPFERQRRAKPSCTYPVELACQARSIPRVVRMDREHLGRRLCETGTLKKPSAAAHYMAKAANYLTKGSQTYQGAVRGNRFGITKDARPPIEHYFCFFGRHSLASRCASAIWAGVIALAIRSRFLAASVSPAAAARLNHLWAST
jgi:hypothetical protein